MERGFTLVEIAIVVGVLGLLLASLLGPLSVRIEQQEIRKTSDQMEEMKDALYGYAMANGALPCPDTGNPPDGTADAPCTGAASEGWLPWVTLGVDPVDAWGFLFRYRVTVEFTVKDVDGICTDGDTSDPDIDFDGKLDLCDPGDIEIKRRFYDKSISGGSTPPNLAGEVPAVIISYGKNGYGAKRLDDTSIPTPQLWTDTKADEERNTNVDVEFLMRHYTAEPAGVPLCDDDDASDDVPYCEFDDIVVWISANVLRYRLVQAGRLP